MEFIMEDKIMELSHKEFLQLHKDPEKTAAVIDLVYVNDREEGISRVKKGKGFTYYYQGKCLKDKSQLERIRKLAIPPAWTGVWICAHQNGHIQATGLDQKRRKQYRYHTLWHSFRNETKFHRLYEFGKLLPSIRLRIEEDLAQKELTDTKVIAMVISLMERTYIRIGSENYEKLYGSYGLTTLKDKHVSIEGDKIHFSFKGKKGIEHQITLKNKKLAKMVKECRDLPGKELFQYYDEEGQKHSIDSGMVNAYIQEASGADFTAKDFRTWAGTLNIIRAFKSIGKAASESEIRKNIISALDEVSKKLGNSRTVCKKYYVHPGIIRLYEEQNLNRYLDELDRIEKPDELAGLTSEEKILMKLLKQLV